MIFTDVQLHQNRSMLGRLEEEIAKMTAHAQERERKAEEMAAAAEERVKVAEERVKMAEEQVKRAEERARNAEERAITAEKEVLKAPTLISASDNPGGEGPNRTQPALTPRSRPQISTQVVDRPDDKRMMVDDPGKGRMKAPMNVKSPPQAVPSPSDHRTGTRQQDSMQTVDHNREEKEPQMNDHANSRVGSSSSSDEVWSFSLSLIS